MKCLRIVLILIIGLTFHGVILADQPKRLLLVGQSPDKHPKRTHEYMPTMKLLHKRLKRIPGLQLTMTNANEPWREGPRLLDKTDGVVIFVSEGAKWMHQDPRRLAALKRLAKRGGGIVILHWGMGTRKAKYIQGCLDLLGGCHGGPKRKYQVVVADVQIAKPKHPITRSIKPFKVRDEFYYRLNFRKLKTGIQPILNVKIDGKIETVAWAWQRPDKGRSFGFTGLHFHDNWLEPAYERLIVQAILWSNHLPIPKGGVPILLKQRDLYLP